MAEIELKRTPPGARREKTVLAKSGSLDVRTVSIQPLDECDDNCGGDDNDDETPSSKPKSLQIRVGKAKEKKWREWSGECECECRKDSMEAQAAEI